MKKLWISLIFFPLFCFAFKPSFNEIIFLGDSLSDTGNLYKYLGHVLPKSPPYYKGRFSDGPVWAEQFYKNFFPNRGGVESVNYAVGGASAVLSPTSPLPYTLSAEVSDYLFRNIYKDKSKVLFVVWIGGNNYLKAPQDTDHLTSKVVDAISYQIKRLISHGADKFLVIGLPDLAKTPEGIEDGVDKQLHELSFAHNRKLHAEVMHLERTYPDVRFIYYDAEKKFAEFFKHPDDYQIHNIKEACYEGGYTLARPNDEQLKSLFSDDLKGKSLSFSSAQKIALLQEPLIREALNVAYHNQNHPLNLNCNDYLFWDHIHPSHHAHEYISKFTTEAVINAGLRSE